MMRHSENRRIRDWLNRVKRFFKPEPEAPEDPYAYVTAPKKPGPPNAVPPLWRIPLRTDAQPYSENRSRTLPAPIALR